MAGAAAAVDKVSLFQNKYNMNTHLCDASNLYDEIEYLYFIDLQVSTKCVQPRIECVC